MRPRFVTKVVKDGETIMEFPPEVLHERIAKEQSIKKIQTILEQVVSIGLGKKQVHLTSSLQERPELPKCLKVLAVINQVASTTS